MPTRRRSGVIFCIAVLALAAFIPGGLALACALIEPQWVLLPDLASVPLVSPVTAGVEGTLSLLGFFSPRGPPSSLFT